MSVRDHMNILRIHLHEGIWQMRLFKATLSSALSDINFISMCLPQTEILLRNCERSNNDTVHKKTYKNQPRTNHLGQVQKLKLDTSGAD